MERCNPTIFFLEQPTALVLVIISALLILLGSKKTPRIGYVRHMV